jgi:hypothetical protein
LLTWSRLEWWWVRELLLAAGLSPFILHAYIYALFPATFITLCR